MKGITFEMKISNFRKIILLCVAIFDLCIPAVAQDQLLIMRMTGKDFDEVIRGMVDEFEGACTVTEMIVTDRTKPFDINRMMTKKKPKLVVLLDNKSIRLYKEYQNSLNDSSIAVPSVSLMGVLVNKAISKLKNATGICYEIPIVTSVINLQAVLSHPIKTVGVVHRDFMTDFIAENRDYCKKEKIEIASVVINGKDKDIGAQIEGALSVLKTEKNMNALWLPNDNILLKPELIRDIWIPFIRNNNIPVIVGVDVLVDPRLDCGTFAVLPDNVALGAQAAQMIMKIKSNNWVVGAMKVEPPVSIYKVINLKQAKEKLGHRAFLWVAPTGCV